MKLARTGDVVQETSAGVAESSVNVVTGHVRSIKLAVESASGVEVPADHDLLTWMCAACLQHAPSVFGWSRRQNSIRKKV